MLKKEIRKVKISDPIHLRGIPLIPICVFTMSARYDDNAAVCIQQAGRDTPGVSPCTCADQL